MSVFIPPTPLTGPAGATPSLAYAPPSPDSGSPARPIIFRLSGTFRALQVVFEGSPDLTGAFAGAFPIRCLAAADGSTQSGAIAVPDSPAANPLASAYYVFPDAGMAVRVRVVALGSGSPVADGRDTDFFYRPAA